MEKPKKIEIRSSQYPYEMSAWLSEKIEHVAEELGYLHDSFQEKYPDLLKDEDVIEIFYPLLYDLSKILSFAEGTEWRYPEIKKDATIYEIFKANGLGKFTKLGREEIALEVHVKAVKQFLIRWKDLIAGSKAESRTLLHELFMSKGFNDSRADSVEELLYQVSDGQLSWEQFEEQSIHYINWLNEKPFHYRCSDIESKKEF
jgi:hypothetical protein